MKQNFAGSGLGEILVDIVLGSDGYSLMADFKFI